MGNEEDSSILPLLAYMTGISLMDLRMKIERRTKPRTMTSMKIITHPMLLAPDTSP